MRFVTYNIRHAQGLDQLISTRRISWTLRALEADVVGLNEVLRLGGRRDQAQIIAAHLGMAHNYAEAHSWWIAAGGNAIMTRGRIVGTQRIELAGGIENRVCLVATIEVDDALFRFASAHLSLGRDARRRSLEQLLAELPDDLPIVLAGDFNAPLAELDPLRGRFTLAETPPTFPSWRPKTPLDIVAHSSQWRQVGEAWAARSLASDHLPLVVDLALQTSNARE